MQSSVTFATQAVGRYVIGANADRPFADAEWNTFVGAVNSRIAAGEHANVLIYSAGSGPNAMQRARLNIKAAHGKVRVAILTDSPISRAAIKAMGWMARVNIQGFAPADVHGAFSFLEIPNEEQVRVEQALSRVKTSVGI